MRQISKEYQILIEFVRGQPDGASLDYDWVQKQTGVQMNDHRNRAFLSRAIHKTGRRALVFPGIGYQLDDPENTMQIIDKAGVKVYRQIKRSSTTTRIVTLKHFEQLDDESKQRLQAINKGYSFLERKSSTFEEVMIKTIKEIQPPNIEDRK
jgi:hypothetical protein